MPVAHLYLPVFDFVRPLVNISPDGDHPWQLPVLPQYRLQLKVRVLSLRQPYQRLRLRLVQHGHVRLVPLPEAVPQLVLPERDPAKVFL